MDALVQTFTDLASAEAIGQSLANAPDHIVRLLRLFTDQERATLLKRAADSFRSKSNRQFSIDQFIAWGLFTVEEPWHAAEPRWTIPHFAFLVDVPPLDERRIHRVLVDTLPHSARRFIDLVSAGKHPGATTALLMKAAYDEV